MAVRVTIRHAERADVAAIAAMFAQDTLGGHGDSADPADLPDYLAAFDRIAASPNDSLFVAVCDGEVVGTFQTTLITSLTGKGASNLTVEAVHTRVRHARAPDRRGDDPPCHRTGAERRVSGWSN
jgi:hypothetical protein